MSYPCEYPVLMSRARRLKLKLGKVRKDIVAAERSRVKAEIAYLKVSDQYLDAVNELNDLGVRHGFPVGL